MVRPIPQMGRKPAQNKITAIVEMPPPCSKKEVQSFIGMINCLTKFLLRLTELSEANQRVDQRKSAFQLGPRAPKIICHAEKGASKGTQFLLTTIPRKETILQTDSSTKGLGACLLQDKKPIYFTSKAPTEAQRGYMAIEIESLAVAWAVEKFHHFLYGSHFHT